MKKILSKLFISILFRLFENIRLLKNIMIFTSVLQGLFKIAYPAQGFPPVKGGIHSLCKVWVPPPHAKVQLDQSCLTTQYPSIPSIKYL
jgi:hypothetical protein